MSPEKQTYLEDTVDEATTCLHAAEAFFQERGIEVVSSFVRPDLNYFTVCINVSENFSFMAVNRYYVSRPGKSYHEELDLHRYMLLESWTLVDHARVQEKVDYSLTLGRSPIRRLRTSPVSYSGLMEEMLTKWRFMEKELKSMSYEVQSVHNAKVS